MTKRTKPEAAAVIFKMLEELPADKPASREGAVKKFIYWFCEAFGKRDTMRSLHGDGDFTEERGWWVFGRWVSAENKSQKMLDTKPSS